MGAEKKEVPRSRLLGVGGALLVLAVASWVSDASIHVNARTTLPKRFTCPPNVSAQKCAILTGGPFSQGSDTAPPPLVPGPTTTSKSPSLVKPGPSFLSSSTESALVADYGMLTIFRYHDWWVVLGNGQNQTSLATPPPMSPGGPLVAVEKCQGVALLACRNPDTPHSLAAFVVVPSPASGTPLAFFGTSAGHLLYFANNLTLDLDTLRWYRASVTEVAKHPGTFSPLTTAPPRQGIPLP